MINSKSSFSSKTRFFLLVSNDMEGPIESGKKVVLSASVGYVTSTEH